MIFCIMKALYQCDFLCMVRCSVHSLFQTYSTAELENKLCDLEYKLSVKGT
jgi:hypothetical protein